MELSPDTRAALVRARRKPEETSDGLLIYTTPGGTVMVASPAKWSDDDKPHDLVAVGHGGEVAAMRVTVSPDLVAALRAFVSRGMR